jgi:hypothetical protein
MSKKHVLQLLRKTKKLLETWKNSILRPAGIVRWIGPNEIFGLNQV